MLHSLEEYLNRNYPGEEPSLLQGRMREFEKRTGRTLKEAANEWHEKVEVAVSAERFGEHNSEIASREKSGRNRDVVAKAIAARVRKSVYVPIYTKMWQWLEAGNKPAEFIRDRLDLLRDWHMTVNYAYKMFNRVKGWREKKIEISRPGLVGPTEPPD